MATDAPVASLQDEVNQIWWWHTIDLGNGVVTKGGTDTPTRLHQTGMPNDLTGWSVLDIGAWDGFFSFEAEKRGARRVVALDHVVWNDPTVGRKGFELARRTLDSKVEDVDCEVHSISPETAGGGLRPRPAFRASTCLPRQASAPGAGAGGERLRQAAHPGDARRHGGIRPAAPGVLPHDRVCQRPVELVRPELPGGRGDAQDSWLQDREDLLDRISIPRGQPGRLLDPRGGGGGGGRRASSAGLSSTPGSDRDRPDRSGASPRCRP